MTTTKTTLYGTPTCHYCKKSKEYLTTNNIPYEYVDASTDEGSQRFATYGVAGVPLLTVVTDEGEKTVLGFKKEEYDTLFTGQGQR